jgi:hypothetical protein
VTGPRCVVHGTCEGSCATDSSADRASRGVRTSSGYQGRGRQRDECGHHAEVEHDVRVHAKIRDSQSLTSDEQEDPRDAEYGPAGHESDEESRPDPERCRRCVATSAIIDHEGSRDRCEVETGRSRQLAEARLLRTECCEYQGREAGDRDDDYRPPVDA